MEEGVGVMDIWLRVFHQYSSTPPLQYFNDPNSLKEDTHG
jgi:hypothetical protein